MGVKNSDKSKGSGSEIPLWERNYFQYGVIVLLVFVQFVQTSKFDYALDDSIFITKNSRVKKGWKDIPGLFTTQWSGVSEDRTGFRPVTLLSFATDVQLFGLNPHVSHIINLLIYALACIVLMTVLRKLFPKKQWLVFLLTVLYAVHPVHVEVVANIKSRDELLAMLFGVLFIGFHLSFFKTDKLKYLFIAPIFYILSSTSKESGITFVGVSVAIALFSAEYGWGKRLRSIVSSISVIVLIVLAKLFFDSREVFVDRTTEMKQLGVYNFDGFLGNPLVDIESRLMIMANGMVVLWQSVKMFFLPYPLVHDYSFNHFPIAIFFWTQPKFWMGTVLFIGLVVLSLYGFKRKSMLTVGAAWFLITISIYLSIVVPSTDIFAERFLFVPSIGLGLLVMGALDQIPQLSRTYLNTVVVILALPLLAMSYSRVPAWKDTKTLVETDIDKLPNCVRANYNYALQLHQDYDSFPRKRRAGDEEKILLHYKRALDQSTRLANLYLALGNAYMRFKQPKNGVKVFRAYAKEHPYLSKPFEQLGNYYVTVNRFDSAVFYFSKAVEVGSIDPKNYLNLALANFNGKRPDEAISAMKNGQEFATKMPEYYEKFAALCVATGNILLGIEVTDKGLTLFPNNEKLAEYRKQLVIRRAQLKL